jgi:hypothetical protein
MYRYYLPEKYISYVLGDAGHALQPGGAAGGRAGRRLGQAQPRCGGLLPGGLRGGGVGATLRGNQGHVAHPSGQEIAAASSFILRC